MAGALESGSSGPVLVSNLDTTEFSELTYKEIFGNFYGKIICYESN